MSRLLQLSPRRLRRALVIGALGALAACDQVTCPEELSELDGMCVRVDRVVETPGALVEVCDGFDNDDDDAVDEDWPELGEPCGGEGGIGECVEGAYVCTSDGKGVVCEGAVGPVAEVCDGKDNDCDGTEDNGPDEVCDGEDNDCDGTVDEGVLSVKQESFGDRATVAAIDGGFVVTRLLGDQIRVETYSAAGERTGYYDDIDNPSVDNAFLESSASGGRVVVGLGQYRFHVLEAYLEESLIPVITGSVRLHRDWDQGIDFGIYHPPYNPRVAASPPRFVGHQSLIAFAVSPFAEDGLDGLTAPPKALAVFPYLAYFDAAGGFVVWEQGENVRAGWLLDNGDLVLDIDVGRGAKPAIALGADGPGVAYIRGSELVLSELGALTLRCIEGRFCDEVIDAAPIEETATTAIGLAFDDVNDAWVVAVDAQVVIVARRDAAPVVKQAHVSEFGDKPPRRIDVAASGGTAAIVQADERGDSVLTFMGCF